MYHVGPSSPVPIEQYGVIGVSFELAIIQWTVPRVAYVPETYMVVYSEVTEVSQLQVSEVVMGTTNLTSVNDEYTIVIRNLLPDTLYSYQISASNIIVTRFTPDATFTTSRSGT